MNIFIFTYNTDIEITKLQLRTVKNFIPNSNITIVDNSSSNKIARHLFNLSNFSNISYIRIERNKKETGSQHHAYALDKIYKEIIKNNSGEKVLFLDHDVIPINPLPLNVLGDHDIIVWNYYEKLRKLSHINIDKDQYLWPGLLYLNTKIINGSIESFQPSNGRDTGWRLKELITKNSAFFTVKEITDGVSSIPFEIMSLGNLPLFAHMSNGSNWSNIRDSIHTRRKKTFISYVQEKIGFLTSSDDWSESYKNVTLQKTPPNDPIRLLIEKNFTKNNNSCFEIGCYPGRYLSVFAELGYIVSGIDYYPNSKNKLGSWFTKLGYKYGEFYEEDILSFKTDNRYDIVCSFGFIEHFVDWKMIIDIHISLLTPNGYILITAPNFNNPLQKIIRSFLDKKNLEKHRLESINILMWGEYLEKRGFKKIYSGYFGKFDFWFEPDLKRSSFEISILRFINNKSWIFKLFRSKIFSAYCGVIFKNIVNNPEVAILMPVYNGEKYLHEAIDSILSQTFGNFVFIIIDDGSTDKTVEIIKSYNDNRIKLLLNEKHMGISYSLNKGILSSNTKYIARMDCDDISLPNRIKEQVNFMNENLDIGVCGTYVEIFGFNKNRIQKFPLKNKDIKFKLLSDNPLNHPTVIMRRNVLNENGLLYNVNYDGAEDYDLWERLSVFTKLENLPKVLLKYREHANQISRMSPVQKEKIDEIQRRQYLRIGVEKNDFSQLLKANKHYKIYNNWPLRKIVYKQYYIYIKKFIKKILLYK